MHRAVRQFAIAARQGPSLELPARPGPLCGRGDQQPLIAASDPPIEIFEIISQGHQHTIDFVY